MANWLCQLIEALEDRVERIELTLDRLNINTGQHATLRGSNYEISERQIAQWVAGTTLPLGASSSYVRFKDGNLEIRGGKFDIHTGEADARMQMDGSGLQGYNAAGNQTIDLDWTTGNLWAKKGGFGNTKAAPLIVLNEDGTATISGWDINSSSLSKNNATLHSDGYLTLGTGNDIVKLDATDETWRLWAGAAVAEDAPFRVDKDGNLVASAATITGTVTATTGYIGGWEITAHKIQSVEAGMVGIILGSASQIIKVGDTDGAHILLDGANGQVGVSNFSSGVSGWRIEENGDAEFNNINARGVFRTPVFLKEEVASIGGTFLVSESAALTADCTTSDGPDVTFTFNTKENYFSIDDIVRCKPGATKQFWAKITDVAVDGGTGTHIHTAQFKSGDTETTFEKGTAVVGYGGSGQGLVQMTATLTNAPYINIFTHAAEPWTTITERVRLGKLDGITDDEFGELTGYGLWTDNGYFSGELVATDGELQTLDIADRLTVDTDGEIYSANKYLIDQDGFFIEQGASAIFQFVEDVEAEALENVGALFSYSSAGKNVTELLAEGSASNADGIVQLHARNDDETLEWHVAINTSSDMFTVYRNANAVFWIDVNEDATVPRGKLYVRQGVVLNDDGLDSDSRIEGLADVNLFYVDASEDRVGIGTSTPQKLLDVDGDLWVNGSAYLANSNIVAAGRTAGDQTIYIDFTSGNDSTGDGTSGSPYATLTHVITNVLPLIIADTLTICVSGGTSTEYIEWSGFSNLKTIEVHARDTSDNDLYDEGQATGGGNDYLDDTGKAWNADQFNGGYIWIYYGTGAGQIRSISDTTTTRITVSANWTTNPDATSDYVIGGVAKFAFSDAPGDKDDGLNVMNVQNKALWYGIGFVSPHADLKNTIQIKETDLWYCYVKTADKMGCRVDSGFNELRFSCFTGDNGTAAGEIVAQLQGSSIYWNRSIIVETGGTARHTGFGQRTGSTANGPANYRATRVYDCDIGYQGQANSYNGEIDSWTFSGCTTDIAYSDVQAANFIPITTPLTSTSFDGDSFSDTAAIQIDLSSVFGVPANAKAVLVRIVCRDSDTWGTDGMYFAVGPTSSNWYSVVCRPFGGDVWNEMNGICPCDGGDIYYKVGASGTNTLDATLEIHGYWV